MTHSLRTAALAIAGTCFAAGAAEACLFSPTPTYTAGYYPGYYTAAYAPSYVNTSYYGFASYGTAYGAAYGSGCCTPSYSCYTPACTPCGDPCGCDPCGGCGVGGCGVGGCDPAVPAQPAPGGQPVPSGGPVPRDPGDYPTPAVPGDAPGSARPRTFIEEPLPQDTQPPGDSGFGPLRDDGRDYDGGYDRDRQPPEGMPPGGQPDGFAPKQPTFDEPAGNRTFDNGTYGGFGGGTDTRLRLPNIAPWRPDSGSNPPGDPIPSDWQKTDAIRGRRPVPALNLDDKIARRPTPPRTRLTDRGESSWLSVVEIERRSESTATNAGWLPNGAPTQVVSK